MSDNEIIENEEQEEIVEQEEVEQGPSSLSLFVDKIKAWLNQQNKTLVYGVTAVIVLTIGYLAYQFLYKMPLEKEGLAAIFKTEELFDSDSFRLVLKDAPQLADKYSGTKAGERAAYMAGASYMQTGDFKKAIEFLEQVDFSDQVLKYQAIGLLGDAYVENKDIDAGLKQYIKAAKGAKNEFSVIWWYKKAARVYEKKNEWQKALDIYEILKKEYKESDGVQEIDKYIARAQAKLDSY